MKRLAAILTLVTLSAMGQGLGNYPSTGWVATNLLRKTDAAGVRGSLSVPDSNAVNVIVGSKQVMGVLTNNILYVSAAAADDTGNGSAMNPYQSTTNALAHATNCTIYVTTGQYQWGGLGRPGVNWYLDSDAIVGSSSSTAGPIFVALAGTNFAIAGTGQILASATSIGTVGTGTIRLDGVYVSPATTNGPNVSGSYRQP